jgi:hypothetical protein
MASDIKLSALQARFASSIGSGKKLVTRRQFLKAGIAASIASGELANYGLGFSIVEGPGWLSLRYGGTEKFRLNASRFHGRPRLWQQIDKDVISFGLRNARFPGTSLSADLACELWSGAFGTQVSLTIQSLGVTLCGYAKEWLDGNGLTSPHSRATDILDDNRLSISLGGSTVSLNALGQLTFHGHSCASVGLDGRYFECDNLRLQLADAKEAVLKSAPSRCTQIVASRGSAEWPLTPPAGEWSYHSADGHSVFDQITIEAYESATQRRRNVFIATRDSGRAPVSLRLDQPLQGSDGKVPTILLGHLVYARALSDRPDAIMTAEMAKPVNLKFGKLRLLLRNPAESTALKVVSDNAGVEASFVADATLQGNIGEAIVSPAHSSDTWPVWISGTTTNDKVKSTESKTGSLASGKGRPLIQGKCSLHVLRPSDFLDLGFDLENVALTPGATGDIIATKDDPSKDSLLIVRLPPQTLVEAAFGSSQPVGSDQCSGVQYPADVYLPEESRLVFKLFTDSADPQFLDLDLLLGWEKYPVSVCGGMVTPPATAVPDTQSAVVMPGGLTFSPVDGATFETAKAHLDFVGAPEDDTYSSHTKDVYRLWTGRLSDDQTSLQLRPVKADLQSSTDVFGLSDSDRQSIVSQLSGPSLPIQHMVVSTAGGWLKGATRLNPNLQHCDSTQLLDSVSLNIAAGIEQLEEVAYPVFLIPTGHRASLVKTTMRQWCRDASSQLLEAPLIYRFKIVLHEKTRTFDNSTYWTPGKGYPFPFKQVSMAIKETPTLYDTAALTFSQDCQNCAPISHVVPYWAYVGTSGANESPFYFPVVCRDRDGNDHPVSFPMVVAAGIRAYDDTNYIASLLKAYADGVASNPAWCPDFQGNNIAYAASNKPGDAAFPTRGMVLYGVSPSPWTRSLVPIQPQMLQAALTLSTTAGFSSANAAPSQLFQYDQHYLDNAFDNPMSPNPNPNAAEIILSVANNQPAPFSFYPKMAGGLLQPSTQIAGLSRAFGNIFTKDATTIAGALNSLANDVFSIANTFGDLSQLLGAFPLGGLSSVLNDVSGAMENAAAVPKLIAQQINELSANISLTPVTTQITNLLTQYSHFSLPNALGALLGPQSQSGGGASIPGLVQIISYINAFVFEQLPSVPYADGETALSALGALFGSTSPSPVSTLQTELAQSLQYRMQQTTTLGDPTKSIVTLNHMRDYILTAGLNASDQAGQWWLALSAYPSGASAALQSALSSAITNFQMATQNVIAQVLASYNTINVALTTLNTALSAKTDLSGIVASLQQLATLLTNVPNSVASLNSSTTVISAWNSALSAVNSNFTSIVADFKNLVQSASTEPALSSSAQDVLKALQTFSNESAFYTLNPSVVSNITTTLQALSKFYVSLNSAGTTAANAISSFLSNLNIPQQIRASYDYDTSLGSSDLFIASKVNSSTGTAVPSTLSLHTSVTVNLPGSGDPLTPDVNISAAVSNFTLLLLPEFEFLSVGFTQASVSSTNGSTPQVNCSLDSKSIQFVGPLNFVAGLAEQIGLPPGLTVQLSATGVSVAYDLSLPSIPTGFFNLTGVNLYSGLTLDFTGAPLGVTFGFANPNQHFLMTYTIFGGGGYLDFSFSPLRGVNAIGVDGALEFGAEAALDFGVASGDLYIFGGFLFNMTGDEMDLGGYVRAGGDLSVLDLITASVEFSMSLTYENRNGKAWLVGDCEISVDVDIAFVINESVSIDLHEEFAGS